MMKKQGKANGEENKKKYKNNSSIKKTLRQLGQDSESNTIKWSIYLLKT